jgi:hypothetical protein
VQPSPPEVAGGEVGKVGVMTRNERLLASIEALSDLCDTMREISEGLDPVTEVVVLKARTSLTVQRGRLWMEYSRRLLMPLDKNGEGQGSLEL